MAHGFDLSAVIKAILAKLLQRNIHLILCTDKSVGTSLQHSCHSPYTSNPYYEPFAAFRSLVLMGVKASLLLGVDAPYQDDRQT